MMISADRNMQWDVDNIGIIINQLNVLTAPKSAFNI
jgi:hypothetical protein